MIGVTAVSGAGPGAWVDDWGDATVGGTGLVLVLWWVDMVCIFLFFFPPRERAGGRRCSGDKKR